MAILAVFVQAFEKALLFDSSDLTEAGESGSVANEALRAFDAADNLLHLAAVFLCDSHRDTIEKDQALDSGPPCVK